MSPFDFVDALEPKLPALDLAIDLVVAGVPVRMFGSPTLRELIIDMFDTMRAAGGVGLAAPQIGVSLQVVIFGFERSERYPDAPPVPLTVLINPQIVPLGDAEVAGWEGCVSVPGLPGEVWRPDHIRYSGFDPDGVANEREVSGFHARVVQHECDHLNGVLYPMRVRDFAALATPKSCFPS